MDKVLFFIFVIVVIICTNYSSLARPGKTDPRPETRTEQSESIPERTSEIKTTDFDRTSKVTRPITEPNRRLNMTRNDPTHFKPDPYLPNPNQNRW